MYRANAVWWRFPLELRVKELAGAVKMSESAVKNARRELIEGEYILHEKQTGNRAARYFILSNVTRQVMGTVLQSKKCENR